MSLKTSKNHVLNLCYGRRPLGNTKLLREECVLPLCKEVKTGTKVTFLLGNIMGYNVRCFVRRSVVSARVLYDENPTVDLTQIQSVLRNNQSTIIVYKQEKVVSSVAD
jgi:hypothetical protein